MVLLLRLAIRPLWVGANILLAEIRGPVKDLEPSRSRGKTHARSNEVLRALRARLERIG